MISFYNFKNLTGKEFGFLTVIGISHSNNGVYWECLCKCGKKTSAISAGLNNGTRWHCGCMTGKKTTKKGVENYVYYSGKIITISEAKMSGAKRYFTNHPCSNGHISQRLVSNRGCIVCNRQKLKTYIEANNDKIKTRRKKYRDRNKQYIYQKLKEWVLANPEKVREYAKRSYIKDSKKVKDRVKKWCKNNPEKSSSLKRNYRARKRMASGCHTAEDVMNMYLLQEGKCNGCGKMLSNNYHVDHIVPLILGGTNYPSNLQILCVSCNCAKGGKHPLEWEKHRA